MAIFYLENHHLHQSNTEGTKEVVLRGGPPSVDWVQSNRKINQIVQRESSSYILKGGPPLHCKYIRPDYDGTLAIHSSTYELHS